MQRGTDSARNRFRDFMWLEYSQAIGSTDRLLHSKMRRVLIIEGFSLRERTRDRSLLSPVRLTAMLHTLVFRYQDPERESSQRTFLDVVDQSPADKSKVTDEQLKKAGVYLPGRPHSNDANRHRILWERKNLGRG